MFRSLNILHKGKLDTSHLCFEYMTLTLEKSALALVVQDGGVISHAQGIPLTLFTSVNGLHSVWVACEGAAKLLPNCLRFSAKVFASIVFLIGLNCFSHFSHGFASHFEGGLNATDTKL